MKLICWNVWGLGKDHAFQELKRILREHKPEIIFLCKTKLKVQLMNRKTEALNFQNCLVVDSYGKRGGLALMWSKNITVDVKSYIKHNIDAIVQCKEDGLWHCTRVYGHPKTKEKKHIWELIRRFLGLSSLPWLYIGDFNKILYLNEKNWRK